MSRPEVMSRTLIVTVGVLEALNQPEGETSAQLPGGVVSTFMVYSWLVPLLPATSALMHLILLSVAESWLNGTFTAVMVSTPVEPAAPLTVAAVQADQEEPPSVE